MPEIQFSNLKFYLTIEMDQLRFFRRYRTN